MQQTKSKTHWTANLLKLLKVVTQSQHSVSPGPYYCCSKVIFSFNQIIKSPNHHIINKLHLKENNTNDKITSKMYGIIIGPLSFITFSNIYFSYWTPVEQRCTICEKKKSLNGQQTAQLGFYLQPPMLKLALGLVVNHRVLCDITKG